MTLDRPAPGLVVAQPERGFRYGSEAFWLVGFGLQGPRPQRAADFGTGSGIAAALLAHRGVPTVGFELRPEWIPLWEVTLRESTLAGSLRLVRHDLAEVPVEAGFDLIVSNPPYFSARQGPVASDPWRAAARTESTADLGRWIATAAAVLAPAGRLCLVLPLDRATRAVELCAGQGLSCHRFWQVGSRRVLLDCRPEPGTTARATLTEAQAAALWPLTSEAA